MAGLPIAQGQRRRRSLLASCAVACAAASLLAGSAGFLAPAASRTAASRPGASVGRRPDAPQQEGAGASLRQAGGVAGCLAVVASVMLSASMPQPASAAGSLFAEFGKIEYEEQIKENNYKDSRAKVLEEAALSAKKMAKAIEREAEEKAAAEAAFETLAENQRIAEEAREAKVKKEEEVRQKVLSDLEKRTTQDDPNVPKAQALFQKFFAAKEKEEKKEEAKYQKLDTVRSGILEDLKKSKSEAQKAAEEAEAVALKIEKLAREARATAESAKALAAASN